MSRSPGIDGNIVLIGMPGAGKSTVGVLLAKALSRDFLDTDVHIQSREGRRLQTIIDDDGLDAFRALEERHILELECARRVIATGGSVVYSGRAMKHLAAHGVIVHLDLPLEVLRRRLVNMDTRGVVRAPGQTLEALYAERQPLYAAFADITIACATLSHEGAVSRVIDSLNLP